MSRRSSLLALAVAALLPLAGCSQVDEDTSLDDVPQDEAFRKSLRREFHNVLVESEVECVADEVFSRDDINVGQIMDFAEQPEFTGPVFELYTAAFRTCVDLTVEIPPAAPSDFQRESMLTGLRAAIPTITEDQADCLWDTLAADGVGVREITIAGYLPEVGQQFGSQIESAGAVCLG